MGAVRFGHLDRQQGGFWDQRETEAFLLNLSGT